MAKGSKSFRKGDFVEVGTRSCIIVGDAIDQDKYLQWRKAYYDGVQPPFTEAEAKRKVGYHVQDTATGEVFMAETKYITARSLEMKREDYS